MPQATASATLQVRLRVTRAPVVNPSSTVNTFVLRSSEVLASPLSRDRDPQVSSTMLVAVSFDAEGRELDWRAVQDPRVVRDEGPGETLSGRRLYYVDTDLLLSVPDLRRRHTCGFTR